MSVGGERWTPSAIRPKNGGSGVGSGIEEMDVLIERDERGDVRRGESIEVRGVCERVEPLDRARRGRSKGEEIDDLITGEVAGDSCFGDCVGVLGLDGVCPSRPKMPVSLCPKGRMALNMCVTIVAPALRAFCA